MNKTAEEAKTIVDRIAKSCRPEKIILFGSFARGTQKADSDMDLLIIKKSRKKRPFRVKEVFEALRGLDRRFPLDPIVYTPGEISHRLAMGDYFIQEILEQGKLMYESK